jgi:hypothetical protein
MEYEAWALWRCGVMTQDLGLMVSPSITEVTITKYDTEILTEEQLKGLREHNLKAMAFTHQQGAERLPLGIPINCKVEQPRAQLEHILTPTYKQGDTQYTNGETYNKYVTGRNKFEHRWGFAGRAHL